MAKKPIYGGQAVIEGVMIRGQKHMSMAVRRPNGEVALHTEPLKALFTGRLRRIPLLRGVIVLVEMLTLGTRALIRSANMAVEEKEGESIPAPLVWGTLAFSMTLAIGIFVVLPIFIQTWLDPYISSDFLSNFIEGIIRLSMFLLYLSGIGLIPDIRRVFAYHGAEHMTIHAHEDEAPLEVASVQRYSTAHARCGTAFLLLVVVISIMVFSALGRPDLWLRIVSRIALMPVIAVIAYEIVRFHGAHPKNWFLRIVLSPSLALQALTTRKPDDSQIEVAICALNEAIRADQTGEVSREGTVKGKSMLVEEEAAGGS